MNINYKFLNINKYDKTYVISDLHANIDIFDKFIKEININTNDLLIINGDIFEKGQNSLSLIRRIMDLSNTLNIEIVLGNNDTIFNEWGPYYDDSDILRYINSVQNSILIDIANEAKLNYNTLSDIHLLFDTIHNKYRDIVYFLKDRPHILESEDYIFVHAGIENKSMHNQTYEYLLTAKEFAKKDNYFKKTIIVGHWPSSNYSDNIIKINPYFNNNVISIDGGVSLKSWAQLNYLIIQKDKLSYSFIDQQAKIKILDKQEESKDYYSLIFPNTLCKIKKEFYDKTLVYIPYLHKDIYVNNKRIYNYRGKTYIMDYTNYYMELKENEIVSFVKKMDDKIMVKRNGIIGLYKGRYEFI